VFDRPAARIVVALLGGFALLCVGFFLGKGSGPVPVRNAPPSRSPGATVRPEPLRNAPAPSESAAHGNPHEGHEEHHHFPPEIPRNEASGSDSVRPSGLENLRDLAGLLLGLRTAVAEGDPTLMTQYQQAILQFTRGDEGKALEVIEAFRKEESSSVLDILASAIASDPSFASNPRIQEAFLAIAEKGDENAARRQSAFYFLGQAHQVPPGLQDRIAAFARAESDPALQSGAIQALAQFARTDEARTVTVNTQLTDLARGCTEPMIRANAISAIQSRACDEAALATVAEFLRADRDGEVRRAAAEVLGGAPVQNRFVALAELEKAWRAEPEADVKRAILISIVRAGRADAAASLERLPPDPALARDVQDYLQILNAGETDTARIFEEKARREAQR